MPDIRAEILSLASAAWRRRWLALGLCWALCTAGWVAVYLLPNRYQAEARIYLDTDTLLGPLLRNLAVENDLQRRVQIMQHTLLSRPNLHQVMVATDMILDVKNDADEQEVTNRLEKNTHITAQGPNLFSITYTDANAVRARDVVQALITVLVESNTGQNRKEMERRAASSRSRSPPTNNSFGRRKPGWPTSRPSTWTNWHPTMLTSPDAWTRLAGRRITPGPPWRKAGAS